MKSSVLFRLLPPPSAEYSHDRHWNTFATTRVRPGKELNVGWVRLIKHCLPWIVM